MRHRPEMPKNMNGEHSHIWRYLERLDGRIDQLFLSVFGIMAGIVGVLVAVVLK